MCSAAFRKASALQTITSARVKLDAALLLYTSQPQLCLLPADTLAGKIADLANALGWSYADAAELLTRNAALADFLPYRWAGRGLLRRLLTMRT